MPELAPGRGLFNSFQDQSHSNCDQLERLKTKQSQTLANTYVMVIQ